jgi:hypothetical protein
MHNFSKFLFVFCTFVSIEAGAQSFSSSPYSRFGVGDLAGSLFQPGIAMGGTSIALRNNHAVNSSNPASYTSFDTLSFVFDIATTGKYVDYITSSQSENNKNVGVSYLTFGFPVTKWWGSSIGLIPYSNVGYKVTDNINIDTLYLENTYKGSGGISQFYIGNGFRLFTKNDTLRKVSTDDKKLTFFNSKSLSFGFNTSYYFGSLERKSSSVFPKENYVFDMYTTEKTIINDLGFRFGLQYVYNRQELKGTEKSNKYTIISGITFDNQNNVNAKNTSLVTNYLNIGGSVTLDTVINQVNKKGNITFPMNLGVGFAFISHDRITMALDYRWQQWSASRFFGENDSLIDSHTISFGTQIVPDPFRQYKYLKMVNYRIGGHYTQSYLNIRGQKINDYGVSFGLGLPIRKPDKSEYTGIRKKLPPMINVAVELGQRGTVANNLIREKYIQISLNLSLYDIWFVKRRFN